MEKPTFIMKELPKKMIGHVKRCFLNEPDIYTVCTDYFRYRGDAFNYISVEADGKGKLSLKLGIWFENLGTYLPKQTKKSMTEADIFAFVNEISQNFISENDR